MIGIPSLTTLTSTTLNSTDSHSDERCRLFANARPIGYLSPEGVTHA